jgi:hypothetical protein
MWIYNKTKTPPINLKDSFLVNNVPIRAGIMKKQILAALTPFALI